MTQLQKLADEIIQSSNVEISKIFKFQGYSYNLTQPLDLKQTRELFDHHSKIMQAYSAIKESISK